MSLNLNRKQYFKQPDLIIINASLNWMEPCGSNQVYEDTLNRIVSRCKAETDADIILLTPNIGLSTPFDHPESTLSERVEIIRKTASEQEVCLVDMYQIWKAYESEGYPVEKLLANGVNHPSTAGHEAYARALMKLFE